jgi:hypothetical protein
MTDPLVRPAEGSTGSNVSSYAVWSYDVRSDAWEEIPGQGSEAMAPHSVLAAYDPSAHRVVAYAPDTCSGFADEDLAAAGCAGDDTWLFDPTDGQWREATSAPDLNTGWFPTVGEIAYDPSSQRVVAFSDGRVIAYDAAADAWQVLSEVPTLAGLDLPVGPLARLGHAMVYDALNQRLVVIGGQSRTGGDPMWVAADGVWAFDTGTRQWTELLAATSP